MRKLLVSSALLCAATCAVAAEPLPPLDARVEQAYSRLGADTRVQALLQQLRDSDMQTLQTQIALTEIPAPPFHELARAEAFQQRLQALGYADAHRDAEGNVLALHHGSGAGPLLVVAAHLDTVFGEGTDVRVREQGGRYSAPGIGDDGRGLAALLALAAQLRRGTVRTVGDVLLVADVGEEERGDLRGVKALFREHADIDGFISIDATDYESLVNQATGSRRYSLRYTGPGGHSFGAYGTPSAIHALGRAIAKFAEVRTPETPKTTFTVGTIKGGTSVNAIAADAELGLDMRSNSPEELRKLETRMLALAAEAAADENRRWGKGELIQLTITKIGDRPAGSTPAGAVIVQAARRGIAAVGGEVRSLRASSTDSNIPISLGIPAVTLGGGGVSGGAHSPSEWYEPKEAWRGPQQLLLTTLALVGVEGLDAPLLAKRR